MYFLDIEINGFNQDICDVLAKAIFVIYSKWIILMNRICSSKGIRIKLYIVYYFNYAFFVYI